MQRNDKFTYYLSVEGETEQYYFEHLRDLINADPNAEHTFCLKCVVEKSPKSYAKRLISRSVENIAHICDYESKDEGHVRNFTDVLDELADARETKGLDYKLGYSNYAFELFMVLHKIDCNACLAHRSQYLKDINKAYGEDFKKLKDYKREDNFKRCLSKISLADVRAAMDKAEKIMADKAANGLKETEYKKYCYYVDNPSLSIHNIVKEILDFAYRKEGL